ncbi:MULTISPECIES: hypothetical protein [Pseudomonas]|uniref:Lipoprotein n=2 Tax=Pseudomonadaceae TaxID=135621 RepID=A0A0D0IXV5_9PSED|nr:MULTISPECIES: hypothetical protein [Pseudomonas]KIP87893.1 hypothetical protein RU08_25830 [Pseudomonas fulva]MCW2290357.1 hypothetical protein [Pseudomonas sp. BIGb0408]NYH75070.1 hypothetical protein [Pseudomonas flavescens]
MNRYRLFALLCLLALVSGCASKMDVAINATPDPDYPFDRNAAVLVTTADGDDENALNARYYLHDMVSALKGEGFRNVFTDRTRPSVDTAADLTFTLDVGSKRTRYRYTANDYGQVTTHTSTVCREDRKSKKKDKRLICTHTPQSHYGVVGTSERTGQTTRSTFTLTAWDRHLRRIVYRLRVTAYNENCQNGKVEAFLVQQGLQYLNFHERIEQKRTVALPEGRGC